MQMIHDGQCGLCSHFGEHDLEHQSQLIQLRSSKQAPDDLVEECSHPQHAPLHLQVTPVSGCAGFEPAQDGQA